MVEQILGMNTTEKLTILRNGLNYMMNTFLGIQLDIYFNYDKEF